MAKEKTISPSQHTPSMIPCPVEGCRFKGKSERGIAIHLGKAKHAATVLPSIVENIQRREAEVRQAKRRRLLPPEDPEVIPNVDESMDHEPEVWFNTIDMGSDGLDSLFFDSRKKIRWTLHQTHPFLMNQYRRRVDMVASSANR